MRNVLPLLVPLWQALAQQSAPLHGKVHGVSVWVQPTGLLLRLLASHLLGTTLQVEGGLVHVGEHASGLADVVSAHRAPGDLLRLNHRNVLFRRLLGMSTCCPVMQDRAPMMTIAQTSSLQGVCGTCAMRGDSGTAAPRIRWPKASISSLHVHSWQLS